MQNEKYSFEYVACDYCSSKGYEDVLTSKDFYNRREGFFSIVKCKNCGLVYTNPRPKKESMSFFYSDDAGYFKPVEIRKGKNNIKQKIKRILLREYYGYFPNEKKSMLLKFIFIPYYILRYLSYKQIGVPRYIPNGKLLDIGCSYGQYIFEMKSMGWNVKGLELNEKAATYGRDKLNLDIITGDISDVELNEKFDVIVMRMVLEHVYSPWEILDKVKNCLKPNGVLIINIPDFDGFESKIFGKFAYTLQVPTHLYHFTTRTISSYLKSAGFSKIKIYHHSFDRDLLAPMKYMCEEGYRLKFIFNCMKMIIIRKLILKPIMIFLGIVGKTSRMTIQCCFQN